MTLLEFARGPGMYWALIICVAGVVWRLSGILLLRWPTDHSEPRHTANWLGALVLIVKRSWPHREFLSRTAFGSTMSYVFHIGFLVVLLGFVPHILFIHGLTGLRWPGLPNGLIYATGAVTLAAMVVLLVRRITHPVLRLLSNFDDYFSWLVTAAPIVTGLLTAAHYGAPYQVLLGIHILTVEVFLIWLPFGKLMHMGLVFVSRATTGALFRRKGAAL